MASLLSGFEYDIYISYRQKDNKGERWVTEFVNSLKTELEATFKEDISIYFDENPHDGLLETHDVEASLASKIKCLILIPIISKTFCDTKSFAWQNEFLAFIKIASKDNFDLKVKLANGNVASRILPVRIHDLDSEDKILLENELNGPLRGVEFIYKEPGVNRPLAPDDDENKNLNKTRYRNQINKVANAVNEIVNGLRNPNRPDILDSHQVSSLDIGNQKMKRGKITTISFIVLTLLVGGYFLFPLLRKSLSEPIEKSIAVLPFVNISNDPNQEPLSDGLSEELLTQLSKIKELKVIGRTSSFSFKGKNEDLRVIGEKLGVTHVLEGSVQRFNNRLRITAQLINTKDGSHIWSERFDRNEDDIFKIQDEISASVVTALKLSILLNENVANPRNPNIEAYKLYLKGRHYYFRSDPRARETFESALKIDSIYAKAWAGLALQEFSFNNDNASNLVQIERIRKYTQRALDIDPDEPDALASSAYIHFLIDYNYGQAVAEIERGLKIDPNNNDLLTILSQIQIVNGNTKEAERIALKLVEIDPINSFNLVTYARSLWAQNRLAEAEKEFNSAYELAPENTVTLLSLGLISLDKGNPKEALNRLINKSTENDPWFRISSSMAYFALGRKKESDEMLQSTEGNEIYSFLAYSFAYRKDYDEAYRWINKSIDNKDGTTMLIVIPHFFKDFRNDPRYKEVRERLNLLY